MFTYFALFTLHSSCLICFSGQHLPCSFCGCFPSKELGPENVSKATACRKSLSVYVCLVDIAFIAAGLSVLPQRHTLLDMILSALRECCMLMAILIYMAMPLPTVLGHRKDRSSWTIAAIFPALLAMLVFPVVRHDAICAGNLHCYLFGLCKVAMILSYQCLGPFDHQVWWHGAWWPAIWPWELSGFK